MTQYTTGDYIQAIFQPIRIDDLIDGMARWIGHRDTWECVGRADPEGEYAGQAAFQIANFVQLERNAKGVSFDDLRPPCMWIPECDFEILDEEHAIH